MKSIHRFGAVLLGAIAAGVCLGAVYTQFSPGGALSGTWNSQNVDVGAGTPFITGTLPVARGGSGAGTLTGLLKGNGTSAFSAATSADVISLWSGTCDNTTFLRADGACSAAGAGSVTSVGLSAPAIFSVTGSPVTTSGTLAIAAAGTSGGIPYFDSATSLASSGALTASRIVLGGGAGASPSVLGSLGTSTTLLHGNAAGAPTFSAVSLTADVTGTLAFGSGGTGVASAADDTALISSGSAWVASAIPNCTDTGGNHLNYTSATNALSCGTSSSSGGASTGSFTLNLVGCSAAETMSVTYTLVGSAVTLQLHDTGGCTSNAVGFTWVAGEVPVAVRPTFVVQGIIPEVSDNGVLKAGCMRIATDGSGTLFPWNSTTSTIPCSANWVSSGNKQISGNSAITYRLD